MTAQGRVLSSSQDCPDHFGSHGFHKPLQVPQYKQYRSGSRALQCQRNNFAAWPSLCSWLQDGVLGKSQLRVVYTASVSPSLLYHLEKELLQIALRASLSPSPSPATLLNTHTVVWIYQVGSRSLAKARRASRLVHARLRHRLVPTSVLSTCVQAPCHPWQT